MCYFSYKYIPGEAQSPHWVDELARKADEDTRINQLIKELSESFGTTSAAVGKDSDPNGILTPVDGGWQGEFEAPGFSKADVTAEITPDNYLIITAEKAGKKARQRTLDVADARFDTTNVKVSVKDGIVTVFIGATPTEKPRKIVVT